MKQSPIDLAQLFADKREEVQMLARNATAVLPSFLDEFLDEFRAVAEDFITWLSETDAMLKSGLSERTLRRRFREMLDCGTARWGKNGREYLSCGIPNRPEVAAARARGRGKAA
jgi:hypothetical protein